MSKITTRLRDLASQENHDGEPWDSMQEAADEITRLQDEVDKLKAENKRIAAELKQCHEQNDRLVSELLDLINAALQEKE